MVLAVTMSSTGLFLTPASTERTGGAGQGTPRLLPVDGSPVAGEQQVIATVAADEPGTVDSISVDGAPLATTQTLGHGVATLSFDVGDNSILAAGHTLVRVNGARSEVGGDYVDERVDVTFANDKLVPGHNTIELGSVGMSSPCGLNRDDFTISDVTLTPAAGRARGQRLASSYDLGDGECGSAGDARSIELTFTVEAPVGGLRASLDTTALPDGEHDVVATTPAGHTITSTLTVDNTGPQIAASTPAAGETITASVPLWVDLVDETAVVETATHAVDGRPVPPDAAIGPGLAPGEHTLSVTATDSLGNTATREVDFSTSGSIEPVDVAALADAPASGPSRVWAGSAAGVPTGLDVAGADPAADPAGRVSSPATDEVAVQRFDIPVPDDGSRVLRWRGRIDPARRAALHAWDAEAQEWDLSLIHISEPT